MSEEEDELSGEHFLEGLDAAVSLLKMTRGSQIDHLIALNEKLVLLRERAAQLEEHAHIHQVEAWVHLVRLLEPYMANEALREPTGELAGKITKLKAMWKRLQGKAKKWRRRASLQTDGGGSGNSASGEGTRRSTVHVARRMTRQETWEMSAKDHFDYMRRIEAQKARTRFVLARQNSERMRKMLADQQALGAKAQNFVPGNTDTGTMCRQLCLLFPEVAKEDVAALVEKYDAQANLTNYNECFSVLVSMKDFEPNCRKLCSVFPDVPREDIAAALCKNAGPDVYNVTFNELLNVRGAMPAPQKSARRRSSRRDSGAPELKVTLSKSRGNLEFSSTNTPLSTVGGGKGRRHKREKKEKKPGLLTLHTKRASSRRRGSESSLSPKHSPKHSSSNSIAAAATSSTSSMSSSSFSSSSSHSSGRRSSVARRGRRSSSISVHHNPLMGMMGTNPLASEPQLDSPQESPQGSPEPKQRKSSRSHVSLTASEAQLTDYL